MYDLITFLNESPSRYHAVANLAKILDEEGYTRLCEGKTWQLAPGGKYYVVRNGSSLMAFRIPKADFTGFMMSASHSDFPAFMMKENAELLGPENYIRLNAEKYGGLLISPWLDRPLTVAGRVLVQTAGQIESRLAYVDRDLLMIPNVAIHMNRAANDGYKYDLKVDTIPLLGQGEEKGSFRALMAQTVGCKSEDILGWDLYLCLRQKSIVWGMNNEFLSAQGLDDLQCAYGCFRGFIEAQDSDSVPVYALFDSEEIGSKTRQGADGTFLADLIDRICAAMGREKVSAVANSFMVSADNAHAVHPNHPEFADATHRPRMNGGIVIKRGPHYTTDGASQAVFAALCAKVGVPVQYFFNRSDLSGGGTLGNISFSHLSVNTLDIGMPQLAMHSCFETTGVRDTEWLVQAMTAFYSSTYKEENGVFCLV